MSVKHVLVTGANGFVGRHLCRTLVESGMEVTACIREHADSSVITSIPGHLRIYRASSLSVDADLSSAFVNVDVVIHLAGRAHVVHDRSLDPLCEYRKANVGAIDCCARAAAENNVKRLIYISSIKVNGEKTDGSPFCADDRPGYSDPYGQSKWEAEERLRQIAVEGNMEWVIVRPPLVYGPDVRGNFGTLMQCVYRRIPLPLGSLENSRSLVSVYNLSDFLCLLLDHPKAANSRFVVSDPEDMSTPGLVRHLAEALRCSPCIVRCPREVLYFAGLLVGQKSAIHRLCSSLVVDREKTEKCLGWRAPISIDYGLERTAEWFLRKKQRV